MAANPAPAMPLRCPLKTSRGLMRRLLLATLACISLSVGFAEADQAISRLPGAEQQVALERLLAALPKGPTAEQLSGQLPSARARVSKRTMFSSQAGSWPFEPFVHNGLFRVIAGYQASHPQALQIGGGQIDLAQLHRAVGDPEILRPHKDGYLLSYPLLIAADAALLVENTTLYLNANSGSALINQGQLVLRHAMVQGWSGTQTDEIAAELTPRGFRPFIVSWAGSFTLVDNSTLSRLGYNAYLARGLGVARSAAQGARTPAARLWVRDSLFDELSTAVDASDALLRVDNSRFERLQQYALDIADSQLRLQGNRIDQVRNNSGMRIRGRSSGRIEDNVISATGKAGIEVLEQRGDLLLAGNLLGTSAGNAIQLRESGAEGSLLLLRNHILNSGYSGIDAFNVKRAHVADNRIGGTPEYAISFRHPAAGGERLVLTGNDLGHTGKALIRVEGQDSLILGDNHFRLMPPHQKILAGDLLPLQSQLLDALRQQGCFIQVRPQLSNKNPPADSQVVPSGMASGCADKS
nr:right-handed parallel beta-helix repeat-containing protein [uncultured Pseudomonas sp.]